MSGKSFVRAKAIKRFLFRREGGGKGPPMRPFPVRNAPEELLFAGFADHGHIGRFQVTVFLGTGINSFLGFLLGAVHVGMPYLASDGNRMADMRRQFYTFALNLPGTSVILCELKLVRAVSCRKTSRHRTSLRALIFFLRVAALGKCRGNRQEGNRKQTESQLCRHRSLSLSRASNRRSLTLLLTKNGVHREARGDHTANP